MFAPAATQTQALARLAAFRGGFQAPARRAGPSPATTALRNKLEALQARTKKIRETAAGKGGSMEAAVATIAGGAVAGAIKAKVPTVMGVDTNIVVAAVALGAGLFLVKGRPGGWLVNLGAGVGAVVVSDYVEDMLDGPAAEPAAEAA